MLQHIAVVILIAWRKTSAHTESTQMYAIHNTACTVNACSGGVQRPRRCHFVGTSAADSKPTYGAFEAVDRMRENVCGHALVMAAQLRMDVIQVVASRARNDVGARSRSGA